MTSSNSSLATIAASAFGGAAATAAVVLLALARRRRQELGAGASTATKNEPNEDYSFASPDQTLGIIRRRRSIFPKQYSITASSGDSSASAVPRSVIGNMLETARWAPTHKLTEPWRFIVFESAEARAELGNFLARQYKSAQEASGKTFSQAKYDKKMKNTALSSYIIAVVVDAGDGESAKNPLWEEIASVSMAVQNMLLMATAHRVGAYWSSGSVLDSSSGTTSSKSAASGASEGIHFNTTLNGFLNLADSQYCLGWVFVGHYDEAKRWPTGKRSDVHENGKVVWR